jgi:hypothetical protein
MATEWNTRVNLYAADTDFEFVFGSHQALFEEGAHLSTGGGLLLRPDQHILENLRADTHWEELAKKLESFLGR